MKTILIILVPVLVGQVATYFMFKFFRKKVLVKELFVSTILVTWVSTLVTGFITFEVLRSADIFVINRASSYGALFLFFGIQGIPVVLVPGDFLACWFYITSSRKNLPYREYRIRVADKLLSGKSW